ncbi:Triadin [Balamuthia mandrillaris]
MEGGSTGSNGVFTFGSSPTSGVKPASPTTASPAFVFGSGGTKESATAAPFQFGALRPPTATFSSVPSSPFGASSVPVPSTFSPPPAQQPVFGSSTTPSQQVPFGFGAGQKTSPQKTPAATLHTRRKAKAVLHHPRAAVRSPQQPQQQQQHETSLPHRARKDKGKEKVVEAPVTTTTTATKSAPVFGERKIVRAVRHQKQTEATFQVRQVPVLPGRKIVRVKRNTKPPGEREEVHTVEEPLGEHRGQVAANTLFVRYNGITQPLSRGLIIKAFTPNGRYLLTHDQGVLDGSRTWYLWSEARDNKNVYDLTWLAHADTELLFLTDTSIVFFFPEDEEQGYPCIRQFTLLESELKVWRDFLEEPPLAIHKYTPSSKTLSICSVRGIYPYFSGIVDKQRSIGVTIASGGDCRYDLVSTFEVRLFFQNNTNKNLSFNKKITGMGLKELSSVCVRHQLYFTPSLTVFSAPEDDSFIVFKPPEDEQEQQNEQEGREDAVVKYNFYQDKVIQIDSREKAEEIIFNGNYDYDRVLNLCGIEMVFPHPRYPYDILADEDTHTNHTRFHFNMLLFSNAPHFADYREPTESTDEDEEQDENAFQGLRRACRREAEEDEEYEEEDSYYDYNELYASLGADDEEVRAFLVQQLHALDPFSSNKEEEQLGRTYEVEDLTEVEEVGVNEEEEEEEEEA